MQTKDFWILIIIILIISISVFQLFQINSLKNKMTSNVVLSNGVDMGGWTENEKMMYEHHGTYPARLQQSQAQQAMAGGC